MLQAQTPNPVGAIPGVIDVSPMGAATYTIPIEVVPGTMGMQPNLSIVYNSFGGMGLLGMKWSLAGLSAITRCGQTPYYDNNITAIEFNENDRFEIDGDRLIRICRGIYSEAGAEYATEMENFTRVLSYGGTNGHPDHFKAFTDNGEIVEYGNSDNSKQKFGYGNNTVILSWFINKITDADGNYMTFQYVRHNNELLISSIQYTGNSGLQPYASVSFNYSNLPNTMGSNTYFVGGYGVTQTKLLESISISYNNTAVRKYKFFYNLDSGECTARLLLIVQYAYGENGTEEKFNGTYMYWGEENTNIEQRTISLYPTTNEKILTGNFYGGEYDDLLVYNMPANGIGKGWQLFRYDPLYGEHYEDVSARDTSTKYYALYAQDVNGDGKDELIIHLDSTLSPYKILSLPSKKQIGSNFTVGGFHSINFGDFDGNGTTDIVFSKGTELIIKKVENNMIMDMCPPISGGSYPDEVKILDVNGDGKKNILTLKNGVAAIYHFNGVNLLSIFQGNLPFPISGWSERSSYYFGDLNGDGITDVVAYCSEQGSTPTWKIYISKGVGSYDVCVLNNAALNTTPYNSSSSLPKHPIKVVDINGDGKSDIIQEVYDATSNTSTLNILFSKGWVNNNYIYTKKTITLPSEYSHWNFWENTSFGDIDGNGTLDLVIKKPTTGFPRVVYFSKDNDFEFVKTITDGIGKRIELNYKHKYYLATDECFNEYCQDLKKKYFLSLVDVLSISNGIGNTLNTWQYQYENAVFSSKRKILLGFKKNVCIDNQNNKKDEFLFEYDFSRKIQIPIKQLSFYDNIKTKERNYYIDFWDLYNYNNGLYDRYTFASNIIVDHNLLSNTTIVTDNNNNEHGRLIESVTQTHNGLTPSATNWMHKEIKTYTYATITLNGYQKKTVPTQILTTQQFNNNGTLSPIIADTLTYSYHSTGSNKGRLAWIRKGNIDGSITTSYGNYTPAGLYREKTVSAAPIVRKEYYEYDNTNRFITKIKNHLLHEIQLFYDAKTGNIIKEIDPNGLTATYNYDNFGRLKQINYPDGTLTKDTIYRHTATNPQNAKYCLKITSTGKSDLIVYYDILGREVCRRENGYYYETRYNNKGQIVKTSFPFSVFYSSDTIWNYYAYDNFGRISSQNKPYKNLSYTYNNRKVTITDHLRNNISSYKDYDALGRIIQAKDEGGIINYSYSTITSNNKPRQQATISTNWAITTILFDLWGNRLLVNEPNAELITSEYNKLNELVKQTDAKGNTTTYQYDVLGRVTQKQITGSGAAPLIIQYTYDNFTSNNRGRGKIHQIIANNVVEETFTYNNLSRLSQFKKVIDNTPYTFSYDYNSTGQLGTMIYPSGFAVNYSYSSTGKLNEIRNGSDNNSLIYKVHSRNKFNAPTKCEYGNGVATNYTYNAHGLLTRIQTGNKVYEFVDPGTGERGMPVKDVFGVDSAILNYRYAYNDRALMTSRSEGIVSRLETYKYDNLDRLTEIKSGAIGAGMMQTQTFSYHNNGNISNNSNIGFYAYESKPHAVTQIIPINSNVISNNQCDVTYNFFNQPTQITEGSNQLLLSYGSNQQRNKAEIAERGRYFTRYYINKYYEIDYKSTRPLIPPHHYHYIYGDNGIVALHIKNLGIDSTYYIHTDHLGSYCAITNANKEVKQRNYFDPWGNFRLIYRARNGFNMEEATPPTDSLEIGTIPSMNFTLTDRGFTGHEHYPNIKIINMNGRLYDPVIGRFLSPDNYVQNPGFTQNYNRYSYALNNPLKYKDPTGQWYEDYYDYDGYDDDYDDGPRKPCNNCPPNNYQHDNDHDLFGNPIPNPAKEAEEFLKDFFSNQPDPFDYSDQDEGSPYPDLDRPTYLGRGGGAGFAVSLGGGILEGSANATMKEMGDVAKLAAGEAQMHKVLKGVSKGAKWAGYAGYGATITANVLTLSNDPSAENWARAGVDALIMGSNLLNFAVPGLGTGASIGLSLLEMNGGFDWFYKMFK